MTLTAPKNPINPSIATDKFFNKNLFWQSFALFWLLANYDFLLMLANKSQIIDSIRLYYGYKKCGISSNFLSFWCDAGFKIYFLPYIDFTNLANYWNHFFPRVIQPLFFTYLFVFKIFPFVDKAVHESIEETKLKKDCFVLDKNREMELYKDEEVKKFKQQIEDIKNKAKKSFSYSKAIYNRYFSIRDSIQRNEATQQKEAITDAFWQLMMKFLTT